MIYAELAGGLGNQMFIYAFARALGLRCGEGVTLLDRQDWRDGAPAHTVCALEALNLAPEVRILAQPGFAKEHLKRQNAAKALMIKYEQRQGLMARDWHSWERRCAPVLNLLGLHFATDGYTPAHRGPARDFLAWGYFQSEAYFADFAPTIRAELQARQAPAGAWAEKIRAAGYPVALHLRRGTTANRKTRFCRSAPRPTTPGPQRRWLQNTPRPRCSFFPTTSTGPKPTWIPRAFPPSLCPGGMPWGI